ncbi:hypothetical protein BAY61_22595 [Prauserella marina]|uniref:Transcriptional regulatory protein, C terminal n=1 Tax=Prauserella marina TaxID=530584 RepID=A0A222VTR0_9PSEU|nr:winged helix-turn-helix domain-containing protein [Prauserella marina]ASR37325.1 hypothetical protein BAY61_22595 [Prauserella marina]PWV74819.1 transcriptional regulator [Prauserella marina]SDD39859.1 Transcriptional regulatory protein, C terminal [Prauserella marina]
MVNSPAPPGPFDVDVVLDVVIRGSGDAGQVSEAAAVLAAAISSEFPAPVGTRSVMVRHGTSERVLRVAVPHTRYGQGRSVRIDVASRRVWAGRSPVELTRLEFDLLCFLTRRAGRVCGREELINEVWGLPDVKRGTGRGRTLDVHIRKLRTKLGAGSSLITTVRGVGYRLENDGRVRIEPA